MAPDNSDGLPMSGLDALMRLHMSSMERSGGNGNIDRDDVAASTDAFNNLLMNNVTINRPAVTVAPSGNPTTTFNTAHGEGINTTTTPLFGSQTTMTPSTSYNIHGASLINPRVFEVKTGESTSHFTNTSHYQHHDNYGGNHQEMKRRFSEPMFTAVMPGVESIGGASLAGNRTGAYASDNSFPNSKADDPPTYQRRNSEPVSNVFDDILFDQLYSEGGPTGGRGDIFLDGFHSPPLGTTSPVATERPAPTPGQDQSRPRANSEPPNWDLFDMPSPIPVEDKETLEGQTNLFCPQPSRHLLDTTTVAVATKTGDNSVRTKHEFARYPDEPGRSRQQRRNAPLKRSRSADPLLMQAVTAGDVSHPSDDHQRKDGVDIFRYFHPDQQLDQLGIYSREKPKRRRSEPLMTEDIFSELYDRDKGGKDECSQFRAISSTSSLSSGHMPEIESVVETGNSRQTSDMIQMILGMKKVDSVEEYSNNMSLLNATNSDQITQAPPGHGVSQIIERFLPASSHQVESISTQQTLQPANNDSAMTINPIYASQPMHQNIESQQLEPISAQQTQQSANNDSAMAFNPLYASQPMYQNINSPYTAPHTVPSAIVGPQMMSMQQPPVNCLNTNILSATSKEDELANILDAITETHNNLQLLQSAVAQCQDPKAVESITKAFELTAACSQLVLLLQYNAANDLLNQAWAHIKIVESRLASSGASASPLPAGIGQKQNVTPISSSSLEPLRLPQKSKKKRAVKAPKTKPTKLEELPGQSKDDPEIIMTRLNALMERTIMSQKTLQKYDKKNGLPRSHAQTMVSSSRSRKQLQKGIMSKKWDGRHLQLQLQKKGAYATQNETTGAI
mmetsp:Transcript_15845/g.23991  ORF Transcript_15845/g.23991 Transcript_15845/m.23991 type:complete len:849 (+) Transcript_15845:111-2657(+)